MKQLLFLSLVFLTVSCQTIDEGFQAYQDEMEWKRFREIDAEWRKLYETEVPCNEWEAKLQEFSKRYKKYGDMQDEYGILRIAKLYCDFKILFIQARYEEAYAMGMEALPYVDQMYYGSHMRYELAITAKILGRFPEFQQKYDLWERESKEGLLFQFDATVNTFCDDSLKDMGILEWAKTLEPPTEAAQN